MKKSRKKPYYKDIEVPSQFFVIMLARKKLLFKTLYLRKVLKVASNGCSNLVIMISSFAGLISMTMMISASIQKALESKHVQNSLTLLLIHPREIQPPSSTSCWSIPITTFHKSVLSNQLKTQIWVKIEQMKIMILLSKPLFTTLRKITTMLITI